MTICVDRITAVSIQLFLFIKPFPHLLVLFYFWSMPSVVVFCPACNHCPFFFLPALLLQELLSLAKRKRTDSDEQDEPVSKPTTAAAASTDSETSDSDDEVGSLRCSSI